VPSTPLQLKGDGVTTIAQADPQAEPIRVTVGVDTHRDIHVASARDQLGRRIGTTLIPTTPAGYQQLLDWARQLGDGEITAFGIEGTGCYGAALARYLRAQGIRVVEVNRPDRAARRRHGKSDPIDADAAARAVQAGDQTGLPKAGTGTVEMLRVLRVARQTALKARTQASNAMRALLVTAPPELREQLRGLSKTRLPQAAAVLDPGPGRLHSPEAATMLALRTLGQRHAALTAELTTLQTQITQLVTRHAAPLLALYGIGPDSASALLLAAGDNPERLCSEAAFAALCGASPVQASSGKTIRHRLNRGGDRQANAALYRIVIVRLRWHQPTKDYMARRTAEGKTTKEVIRCLKRYIAREVFAVLKQMNQTNQTDAA